jgi:hypothetical protein
VIFEVLGLLAAFWLLRLLLNRCGLGGGGGG